MQQGIVRLPGIMAGSVPQLDRPITDGDRTLTSYRGEGYFSGEVTLVHHSSQENPC